MPSDMGRFTAEIGTTQRDLETNGGTWPEYNVTAQQLEDRVGWKVAKGAPDLWDHLQARIGAWFEANAEELEA